MPKSYFAMPITRLSSMLEQLYELQDSDTPRQLIGSMLLTCYQKLGLLDKAIALGSSLCSAQNCWDSIKQSYAWVLYFAHFKNLPVPIRKKQLPLLICCNLLP
jgi:hypothetical protein